MLRIRVRARHRRAVCRRPRGQRRPAAAALVLCLIGLPGPVPAQDGPRLTITDDADRRELVLELGPLDLPANAAHHEVRQPAAQTAQILVDGWIHGYRIEIVDSEGRPVPQQVLHHVNVIAPEQRELFSQIMLRVAAAGQETAPAMLPRLLGYRVRHGQGLLVTAAFHNPTPAAYHGAVLRVRMPYTPADAWLRPISVFPFYLDVMPPASMHAYDLPPGHSTKSWEGSPAVPGRILGVGGHLHKYGVALRLEDVTAGEVIWEAEPIVDEAGDVVGMPTKRFFWTLGIPLRPDHVYRLTAIYDNPTGEAIPDGAMGALGGVFVPSPGLEWPAADPDHHEYRLDVRIVTSDSYGHGSRGNHRGAATTAAVDPAHGNVPHGASSGFEHEH